MSSSNNHLRGTEYTLGTHDYIVDDALEIPTYHLEGNTMHIYDVVWGEEFIGDDDYDELLLRLARSPLFRRLQAVEQLTLPAVFSTLPNTSSFSRWQHIWGSLVFVRKMTENDERFSERDRIILQLRTLFSDVGHTAFSHLGDWLFQDGETSEDLHDQDLRALLETFKVDEMLNEYALTLDEAVFPETQDWVECSSPDLCVDRVDYGIREIMRWMVPSSPMYQYRSHLTTPKALFSINDNSMLEVTNERFGLDLASAYNLLPTEHWAQPVHRLQLELMQTAVRRALLDGHFSEGIALSNVPHPRDRLYGIDSDFDFAFHDWKGIGLSQTMKSIGLSQRQIFARARQHDLKNILHQQELGAFPNPIASYSWQSERYGLVAPQVELEQVDTPAQTVTIGNAGLKIGLAPLKARSIDPLVSTTIGSSRLSELNPNFAAFRHDQAATMAHGYDASLLVNKSTTKRLHDIFVSTNDRWQEATSIPRDITDLQEIIGQAALHAAGRRFDTISDW